MAQKAGKPKAVKAWAIASKHSGDLLRVCPPSLARSWARYECADNYPRTGRVIRVLVTPLEPSK